MLRPVSLATVLITCALLAGCGGDSHEAVMDDMIAQMNKVTAVLKTVKDEASAEAAKPKLEAIGKDMKKLKERADKLGDPAKEKEEALKTKYEEKMKEAMTGLMQEMMRIGMNPKLGEKLGDVMDGLDPGF